MFSICSIPTDAKLASVLNIYTFSVSTSFSRRLFPSAHPYLGEPFHFSEKRMEFLLFYTITFFFYKTKQGMHYENENSKKVVGFGSLLFALVIYIRSSIFFSFLYHCFLVLNVILPDVANRNLNIFLFYFLRLCCEFLYLCKSRPFFFVSHSQRYFLFCESLIICKIQGCELISTVFLVINILLKFEVEYTDGYLFNCFTE